jgi:hypothetical protein
MQALFRLKNIDCKVGPKLEAPNTPLSSKSKSRTTVSDNNAIEKSKLNSDALMQSKSWLESRLNYRRLIFKMIKEIETHCEDVICLS